MNRNLNNSYLLFLSSFLFLWIATGCASLPQATVDMSVLLNQQLTVLQENHQHTLDLYFGQKRQQATDYLDLQWYPAYLEKLFQQEYVVEIWEKALDENNTEQRMEIVQAITQIALEEYATQRALLLDPIEEAEKKMRILVYEEYEKAKKMNQAITENMIKVRDVQQVRSNLISNGVDLARIDQAMQQSIVHIEGSFAKVKAVIEK